jgi:hypothetical protein
MKCSRIGGGSLWSEKSLFSINTKLLKLKEFIDNFKSVATLQMTIPAWSESNHPMSSFVETFVAIPKFP